MIDQLPPVVSVGIGSTCQKWMLLSMYLFQLQSRVSSVITIKNKNIWLTFQCRIDWVFMTHDPRYCVGLEHLPRFRPFACWEFSSLVSKCEWRLPNEREDYLCLAPCRRPKFYELHSSKWFVKKYLHGYSRGIHFHEPPEQRVARVLGNLCCQLRFCISYVDVR